MRLWIARHPDCEYTCRVSARDYVEAEACLRAVCEDFCRRRCVIRETARAEVRGIVSITKRKKEGGCRESPAFRTSSY